MRILNKTKAMLLACMAFIVSMSSAYAQAPTITIDEVADTSGAITSISTALGVIFASVIGLYLSFKAAAVGVKWIGSWMNRTGR